MKTPPPATPILTATDQAIPNLYAKQTEMVVNPGAAASIFFVAPDAASAAVGAKSGPITVKVENGFGAPVANEKVDLSTSATGTGVFYDSTGAHVITSVTTDANGQASFLYEDTAAGAPILTATDHANNSVFDLQKETVTAVAFVSQYDTTPSWNGSSNIFPFGNPNTATYGETFIAPADVTLNDFSFHIQGVAGVHLSMKGYVYEWSGVLFDQGNDGIAGNAVGSALFSSPSSISFDGNANDTFQTVTVQTGGTSLRAGQAYVVFLTVSNPDDFAASTGTTNWGYISGQHVASGGGGGYVFINNGSNFSALTAGPWDNFLDGDLAFTVDFARTTSQIAFVTQPANSIAGTPVSSDLRVQLEDAKGNPVALSGDRITLTLNGPGGFDPASTLNPVSIDANGVADFGPLIVDTAGTYTLVATNATAGGATSQFVSASFTVFPAAVTLTPFGAQVNASAPSVPVGASFGLSGTFIDQGQGPVGGALVRISWGDGAVETDPVTVGNGQGAFTASHVYQTQGSFSVTVLVTDEAGNVIGVGALAAPVEALPAGAGTVDTVDVPPGATVTQSVTDVVSGTVTTATLTVAPGDTGGELITAEVKNFVPPPTQGLLQTVASFEIRQQDLQQGDSALITFVVPGASVESGTVPQIYFQDPTTGKETLFKGVSSITQAGNTLVITIRLDNSSTPKLTELTGTVFTVAASTAGPTAVTAVSPAVASTASGPVALQSASFQSTSQLTLTLAASQAGQASTSRSSLSADGGGGDEPLSDADADALIRFLFEKLDLLPKLRLPRNASDAIRMWLNQVSAVTPAGAAGVPAEAVAALDSIFCQPPAAVVPFARAIVPGGARGVVVPPRTERRAPAKSGPALLAAIPLAGLGLSVAPRKKRRDRR